MSKNEEMMVNVPDNDDDDDDDNNTAMMTWECYRVHFSPRLHQNLSLLDRGTIDTTDTTDRLCSRTR